MQENDPERHLRKIYQVVGVTAVIGEVAQLVKRRRGSPPKITKEQELQQHLDRAKDARAGRLNTIGPKHRFILESAAHMLNLEPEILIDCTADKDEYVAKMEQIYETDGRKGLLLYYGMYSAPGLDSGRYNPKQKRQQLMQTLITDGSDEKVTNVCVGVFRHNNAKTVEVKSLGEDLFIISISIPEEASVIYTLTRLLENVAKPALESIKDYGFCTELQKSYFFHGVETFMKFLKSTEKDISERIMFEVDHSLYKGFLLTKIQVEETVRDREKVYAAERAFARWMRQVQFALTQGDQIRRDPYDVGPLHELEYWRSMLTKYTSIAEFIESQQFLRYHYCLKLSRSKLLKKWYVMDKEVTSKLNESRDNVRYISSIERFWDPLYRCDPDEVSLTIASLLTIIRQVYKTSAFYNTSERITGLLSKVTNQIIMNCQQFMTCRGKKTIYEQKKEDIIKKIDVCKNLDMTYRFHYYKAVNDMEESPEETPWECSDMYIFGKMDTFNARLNKIKNMMELFLKYQVIERIGIAGTNVFSNQINKAFEVIASKPYDPLVHRQHQFDGDYQIYVNEVESAEIGLQKFAKEMCAEVPTIESRLLVLNRFERLRLDCLCLDRRYLDIAVMLEKQIFEIKDYYNENRANPPIIWGVPNSVGRIMWARSLFRKMDDPIKVIKMRSCVIEHRKAQLCVKYYNYLCEVLLHYEMLHHRAWWEFVEQAREKLESPVYRKNLNTNWLEVNFHPFLRQTIKEAENVLKWGLAVPDFAVLLVLQKENLYNAYERVKDLLKRNNQVRMEIPTIFLPLMRTMLIKLEQVFMPGLTVVTWMSLNLNDYLAQVEKVRNSEV